MANPLEQGRARTTNDCGKAGSLRCRGCHNAVIACFTGLSPFLTLFFVLRITCKHPLTTAVVVTAPWRVKKKIGEGTNDGARSFVVLRPETAGVRYCYTVTVNDTAMSYMGYFLPTISLDTTCIAMDPFM